MAAFTASEIMSKSRLTLGGKPAKLVPDPNAGTLNAGALTDATLNAGFGVDAEDGGVEVVGVVAVWDFSFDRRLATKTGSTPAAHETVNGSNSEASLSCAFMAAN